MTRTPAQLDAAIDAIQKILGDWIKHRSAADMEPRPPTLPNGEYDVSYNLKQLHFGLDDLEQRLAALGTPVSVPPAPAPVVVTPPPPPPAPVVTPSPAGTGSAGFTPAEVVTLGDLNFIARAALVPPHTGAVNDRIYALNFKNSAYLTWNDPDRGYILGLLAATPAGQDNIGLIQRVASAIGVTIGGSAPVVTQPPASIPTAAGDQVISGNLVVMKKLAVGGPVIDAEQNVQLHAAGGAGVLMFANEDKLDPQNAGYVHTGSVTLSRDGGMRMIAGTYTKASDGSEVWPTPNRPRTIVGLDSMGTLSLSQERYQDLYNADGTPKPAGTPGATRHQKLVLNIDHANKTMFASVMEPGWDLKVRRVNPAFNDWDAQKDVLP